MAGFVGGVGGSFDYVQPGTPSNPKQGESWYDTDANGGDGEVKVYDGGAWNVTGFTDHADLTGVTESAHHNPVTVNDPLAEDGTQGLSMQVGDGLAIVTGALQAALGNALTFDANGNVEVPAGGIDAAELAADAVTATEIAADAVTSAGIAADAVDTAQLANDAVTAARIAAGAVNTGQIAADAVTTAKIAADAVDSAQIAAGAVGTGHLSFDTATQGELDTHVGDTTNPHSVTDSQTGAATALSNHAADATVHHAQPSFASEDGTLTTDGSGGSSVTIPFNSTYAHAAPEVAVLFDGDTANDLYEAGWYGWTTDANGNIDGMNVAYADDGSQRTLVWTVFGVIA